MADRTTLSQDSVAELLEMCLRSTYFSYGGNFNEQKEIRCSNGLPGFCQDGQPYMEFFKDVVLRTLPSRPRLWTRYVDDIFCTHRKVTVEELSTTSTGFNLPSNCGGGRRQNPSLSGNSGQKEGGWRFDIAVYRKPTYTDRYLHFQSHHPTHVKSGLVKCLHNRTRGIISSQDNLEKEVEQLAKVL